MKPVNCLTLVATLSACGFRDKPKPGTFKRCPINLLVMVIKSPQGEKFRENALTHGDKTQVEMAKLWQGEISSRTRSRALKKIGFTRKKRPMAFQERDEAKRQAFVAFVVHLTPGGSPEFMV